MALIVKKFGGTSVGSVERIHAAAEIVAADVRAGHQVVVVVSAMAGETNRLIQLAREVSGAGEGELPPPSELDVIASSGEQVSIGLMSMALQRLGIPAQSWLGFQLPIRTDGQFARARIRHMETASLSCCLSSGTVPVVAGFQGIDATGRVNTLGRGGTDTTAVAVAAALQADECQIYTDVKGVYTTDPRIVPNARLLPRVTFEEMLEMASLGSKVLHPRSVEFAGKYGVTLRVLSSFEPGEGTLIVLDPDANHALAVERIETTEESGMEQPLVSGIAFSRDEAKISVQGVSDIPGVAWKILGPISDQGIEVDMIIQNVAQDGRNDFTFTVGRNDYAGCMDTLEGIRGEIGEDVRLVGDSRIVKVSLVGVGMRSHAGVASRMFEALATESINIQMISTSEIKVSIVIDEKYLELAVRAIHEAFEMGGEPAIAEAG